MKKWAVTGLLVLCLVALGFTAKLWVPWLLDLALHNKEKVESLKSLLELVALLVTWLGAVAVFVHKLWREKRSRADEDQALPAVVRRAGRDLIEAGRDVQTGGVNLPAQGLVSVAGPVAGRDVHIHQAPTSAAVSAPVLNALHSLPPPPADFTGRVEDLRELRDAIEAGGVTISGLLGQGGVGKTALALKLAEKLIPQHPDAQIYTDLRGVSEKPLTSAEAMAYVIRAFQPEARVPEDENELGTLYRSILHGKKALLLMDNARDAAQVKPLIPPAGCALLVTSRHHFTLPGLKAKNLETLPPPDAKELLLRIAPRIDGEAETIAKLCGYLPLALRLAATALAERSDVEPADYTRRLAEEKNRLKMLAGSGESVEASINLSYGLLDSETQKRWRMLAVFPDTLDAPAAASVWEADTDAAQDTLSRLTQYSMLEWNDRAKRYRLHDLMRHFASERLQASEREQAALRHSIYYLAVLENADKLYRRGGESLMRALALFDGERGNVYAGQAWAADHWAKDQEVAQLCNDYPDRGTNVLLLRQRPREQIRWREVALNAARQLKDRAAEGRHLGNLGIAYDALGETSRAIGYHDLDLAVAREIGDRRGEGSALGNLGVAYRRLGETHRAIGYHEQALVIYREIGDRLGEGLGLGNLGIAYKDLGDYQHAIEYYERALVIHREIGDRQSEGRDFGNLGIAHKNLGDYHRAIEYYEQQLAIAREIGDRRGEANALWNTSLSLDELGERKQAIEHAEASLRIREEIEDPHAEIVRKQLEQWRKS
jgi:tetratricopeptide (TPR) repeat protein